MNNLESIKHIPLTQGEYALVDDVDYEELSKHKWHFTRGYAVRDNTVNGHHTTMRMHRQILRASPGDQTDHINRNKLDNRRCNLRLCTNWQNMCNRKKMSNNKSGFKGVTWNKKDKKWGAHIRANKRYVWLGYFTDKEEAARKYNEAAIYLHGDYAVLNEFTK